MEPQKDLRFYWKIFLNRKKFFFIPAVSLFIVAILIALLWPSTYESKSTILIEEQQIPPEFVRATVTGFADQRIQSLTQQILSRTRLWEIVQQFNLYPDWRDKFTREEILERMRDDIKFETISAQVGGGAGTAGTRRPARPTDVVTIAFSIAYRGRDPETVQKVTGTLASLYLEQNLRIREAQAKSTTQFLEAELREIQERIKNLGAQIAKFKAENEGILPELQQFNLTQAERLDTELKQIDNQIKAAEDRKIYLEGQLATVQPDLIVGSDKLPDPKTRLKQLQVVLAELQSKFSADHPDIRKVRREMAELENVVGKTGGSSQIKKQRLAELRTELARKLGSYSKDHPEVRQLQKEIDNLEKEPEAKVASRGVVEADNPAYVSLVTQIRTTENDLTALRRQKAELQAKLQVFRQRLEAAPKVEQEYLDLQRNYQNAHQKYQEILNKITEARIAEGMEEHQKAEKFTLIDPASFPEKPVSPNRLLILLAGFLGSVGAGLGSVFLVENLDHSIKGQEELAMLTGLPVLGTVTLMQTAEEVAQKIFRRRLIWGMAGVSIIIGLLVFHFLVMDLWIVAAKLQRLANKYI